MTGEGSARRRRKKDEEASARAVKNNDKMLRMVPLRMVLFSCGNYDVPISSGSLVSVFHLARFRHARCVCRGAFKDRSCSSPFCCRRRLRRLFSVPFKAEEALAVLAQPLPPPSLPPSARAAFLRCRSRSISQSAPPTTTTTYPGQKLKEKIERAREGGRQRKSEERASERASGQRATRERGAV